MRALLTTATVSAFLSAFASNPLIAQTQQPPPVAVPALETEAGAKAPVAAPKGHRWLKADARVCLEFPSDMQVIKCSEKYR